MAKQQTSTFKQDTEAYLASVGARPWPNGGRYAYVLPTTIGEAMITPRDDGIICRWCNLKKAQAAGLVCNPYTAEWNFRCTPNTATPTLKRFQSEMARFLPPAA